MMSEEVEACEMVGQQEYGFIYQDLSAYKSLQESKEKITAAVAMIPRSVLKTGITPIRRDDPMCKSAPQPTDFANSTRLNITVPNSSAPDSPSSKEMAEKALLNLDCYAYLSISPYAENTISTTGLTVPRGIGFSGKINVLDKFEAAGEGLVRIFEVKYKLFV